MFGINVFFSMLFVKCKTRGEQVIVVAGMLILVAACYGVGNFFLGMGQAAADTIGDASGSNRNDRKMGSMSINSYITVGVCLLLGVIFSIMAVINFVRLVTGTGLADDDGWS